MINTWNAAAPCAWRLYTRGFFQRTEQETRSFDSTLEYLLFRNEIRFSSEEYSDWFPRSILPTQRYRVYAIRDQPNRCRSLLRNTIENLCYRLPRWIIFIRSSTQRNDPADRTNVPDPTSIVDHFYREQTNAIVAAVEFLFPAYSRD